MATTNYNWTLPVVGGSLDTWGTILNAAFESVDGQVFSVSGVASSAQSTANTALSNAATAQSTANAAQSTANAALPAAGGNVTGDVQTPSVTDTISGATLTIDCNDGNVFKVSMTANVTTFTLSNPHDGQTINVRLTQDATGTRTMAWPASFRWSGGSAGVLSTAANAVDLLVATYFADTGHWYVSLMNDLSAP